MAKTGWFDPEAVGRAWFAPDAVLVGAFDRELVDNVVPIEAAGTLTATGTLTGEGAAIAEGVGGLVIGSGGMVVEGAALGASPGSLVGQANLAGAGASNAGAAALLIGQVQLHARALAGSTRGTLQPRHWRPLGARGWGRRVP